MNKLRYYILISRGIEQIKRHARMWDGTYSQQITKADVCFVINTRDTEFEQQASEWLTSEGIEWHTSVSNGGPSKGKNAVLDTFLASDDDYMIQVDGDDMISPHGLFVYKMIANPGQYGSPDTTVPDVICLDYQYGIVPNEGYGPLSESEAQNSAAAFSSDIFNAEMIQGMGYRCFTRPYQWWEQAMAGEWIQRGTPFLNSLSDAHQDLIQYEYKYINKWESHCRIVWYSKAAARSTRFPENVLVGEDVINYFDLKHEFFLGNLEMRTLREIYPTYIYDQRVGGIVQIACDMNHGRGYLDWMIECAEHFKAYEDAGKLHEDFTIPFVDLPDGFADDYRPDTLGLVNYPAASPTANHVGY